MQCEHEQDTKNCPNVNGPNRQRLDGKLQGLTFGNGGCPFNVKSAVSDLLVDHYGRNDDEHKRRESLGEDAEEKDMIRHDGARHRRLFCGPRIAPDPICQTTRQ